MRFSALARALVFITAGAAGCAGASGGAAERPAPTKPGPPAGAAGGTGGPGIGPEEAMDAEVAETGGEVAEPAPARERLFALIRGFTELPALEPAKVGERLGRKPEFVELYAHAQEVYRLVPGEEDPNKDIVGPAELRWMPGSHKGLLRVEVAPDLVISVMDVIEVFKDLGMGAPIVPDPRDPEPVYTRAYPVPIGELRFTFPEDADEAPLKEFVVDQNPLIPWPKKPGTQ